MIYKRLLALLFSLAICLSMAVTSVAAQTDTSTVELGTVSPDTWAAVDGLGRTVSSYSEVGETRTDKYVGVFFWSWHDYWSSYEPRNITQIISANPEARNDLDHPAWGSGTVNKPFFWNEPLFGYYKTTDKYVLRKQAELLADAGVDVIFFDCSNGTETFKLGYSLVFREFERAMADGVNVPKISFVLSLHNNDDSTAQLKSIYKDIYKKEKYKDLWFMWEGKPLLMARYEQLNTNNPEEKEIKEFFTFRRNEPTYFFNDTDYEDKAWGWCSVYPQTKYGVREDGSVEQICVSAAQNANQYGLVAMNDYRGGVYGRGYAKGNYSYSYTYANETITVNKDMEDAYVYGLNFQQQWDYALEVDPDFIFVTGWNEYVCQRSEVWNGTENAFSDNFSDEFSRDIEPSSGILQDNFYYQLVDNIRKFKGVSKPETGTSDKNVMKTVDIDSTEDQWADVTLAFNHYTGSTKVRDSEGYKGTTYTSDTMRNDIVTSKVAYDNEYVYFMVETLEDLTASSDPAWMRLLIDTDATGVSENWEGFEYIINRVSPTGDQAIIEKSTGGWNFTQVGTAKFSVNGKRLQIAVPRSSLGMAGTEEVSFNFKWADNTRKDGATEDSGEITDYYLYGDVAPGARFMFSFSNTGVSVPGTNPDSGSTGIPGYVWGIVGGAVAIVAAIVIMAVVLAKKKHK